MLPVHDQQSDQEDVDTLARDAARLRLEQEFTALPSDGIAQQGHLPSMRIKSRPVTYGNPRAVDITEDFTRATAALETGQLVKDEYFTLFESVGALEIMDPKMDSGFLEPGETLEDDYDTTKEILPEELLGIMDQLLCYEMAWHQGYPLSQTIFTSIYIDKMLWPEPKTLEDATFLRAPSSPEDVLDTTKTPMLMLLRAYCLGLIKCCDNVIQKVTSRDYFEEEDFCTHTYNRNLLTRFPEKEILDVLEQAEAWLMAGSDQVTPPQMEKNVKEALLLRIALRKHLLAVTTPDSMIEETEEGWRAIYELLRLIEETQQFGKPVKDSFSKKIQRRLASTIPPRPVVQLTFPEAFQVLKQIVDDCLEVVRGINLGLRDPQELVSFIWTFNSRKPPPLTYARSCLSSCIFGHPNEMYEDLLRTDLQHLVLPQDAILDPANWAVEPPVNPAAPPDQRFMNASLINEFTNRTNQNYLEFWTTLCQNRCRTRRMLCHNLIAFHNLQLDTEILDQDLHTVSPNNPLQYPLATWVYHQKLRQTEWIVQLGFEQEIYLTDELAGMYFWLSQIAGTHADLLIRILASVKTRQAAIVRQYGHSDDTNVVGAKSVLEDAQHHVESLLHSAKATACLAEALATLYILLHYFNAVPVPKRPFSNPALRYELRMKPFLLIDTPRLPSFEEFETDMHPHGPYDAPTTALDQVLARLTTDTETLLKQAKSEWTAAKRLGAAAAKCSGVEKAWEKGVADCLLSCISAGLAVAGVGKLKGKAKSELEGCREGKRIRVVEEKGKRYHDWWIVPKVEVVEE
ncbi:Mak10-domain-containing protein [Saccharata proteae CBS 121410]|uniref:Mak10-domain-containing protein n=1 Tax=Saccharata proteae CBS 121410 TaxID=1314787 RepID=A0A9P4HS88_9PEZI|nr:Mak10-domain-containing protein [Saccharata proteae CBS 121410]